MRRAAFIQFILAVVLLGLLIGAYAFWYNRVSTMSATASKLAVDIQTKSQESSRIQAAKAALSSLGEEEAGIRQYFVPASGIVPFLESLEQTGKGFAADVEVLSVAANPAKNAGVDRDHLSLSLKITGPFDSVIRTLGAIEYGPYDSVLTSLTFDTASAGATTTAWSAAATFDIGTRPADAP
ncbi:MAG: hypothetical protein AB199_00265 [Parcubacteria bacterium C7867-004]|nr:MAG: hypothetical protein AB199_00265 [Parcubacteria bacterium C7867-004]